jgi:bacteriocin biosynthesis cyclodehydratase domain-containing protein
MVRPGDPDLVVRSPDALDRLLLRALARGAASPAELAADAGAPRAAIEDKLAALLRAGVAIEESADAAGLAGEDRERFARQLPYLAETGDAIAAQRRLRESKVVVLGCGGLGTWALAALASAGIGRVVLVDHDTVELSNLNRQVLYTAGDLGARKVERAAAWVRRFDPAIDVEAVARRVEGTDDLAPLLEGAGALVHAADSPPYELERWVNAACIAARVPFVTAGQMPPLLRVGPAYIPGRTACFACHERALRRASPLYDQVVAMRRRGHGEATTLGPASGVVGTLLALELMHLLSGARTPSTAGRALLVDMRTLDARWEPVERDPGCPACHHLPPHEP